MSRNDQTPFETSDIYLAAYLRYAGLHFVGHRMGKSRQILFQFGRMEILPMLVTSFLGDTALVPPKALRDNVRDIIAVVKKAKETSEPI